MADPIALLFLFLRVLMGMLLYTFLGWTMYILWSGLKQATYYQSAKNSSVLRLEFIDKEFPTQEFSRDSITIGRRSNCDCVLDDKTVSTTHSKLSFLQNKWWIEDLGSRNGTFLNEIQINEPTILNYKDIVRCGKIEFKISPTSTS